METALVVLFIPTPDGDFVARYSTTGLARLEFPKQGGRPEKASETLPPAQVKRAQAWHQLTTRALERMLAAKPAGELPPLDQSAGTDFQRAVWRTMSGIASGRTLSYGEIAQVIGNPKAVRAVGGACGANPIPVLVPCHRVLAAGQKIGGFSGGLDWKRKLLVREGVLLGLGS